MVLFSALMAEEQCRNQRVIVVMGMSFHAATVILLNAFLHYDSFFISFSDYYMFSERKVQVLLPFQK